MATRFRIQRAHVPGLRRGAGDALPHLLVAGRSRADPDTDLREFLPLCRSMWRAVAIRNPAEAVCLRCRGADPRSAETPKDGLPGQPEQSMRLRRSARGCAGHMRRFSTV